MLANLVRDAGEGAMLTRKGIEYALSANRTSEQASNMFDKLLHRGVIAQSADGEYIIPIPSMRDWLLTKYASEKQRAPDPRDRVPARLALKKDSPGDEHGL